jgi:osmoprotectant transport system permease protein
MIPGAPLVDWAWIADHVDDIVARTAQHLQLAVLAIAAGFAISLVLGLWAAGRPRVYALVTAGADVLYTIPSLAAFAALVPITGFSILTALIPLTAYTLLILIRSVVSGLTSIPPDVAEAADGMGYTRGRRLREIELPLAIPLIVAGLRLASVSTIGLVTIAATIGNRFGGLGVFINEGLQQFFYTKVLVGAGMSVLLAIALDLVFVVVQRGLTPWTRTAAAATTQAPEPATVGARP